MVKYNFKATLMTPENQPLQPSSYFKSIGLHIEDRRYSVNSPSKEINMAVQIWQLNLDRCSMLPGYFIGSQMNTVLINSDNLGAENYDKLCAQTIHQMEGIIKSKPALIMWGDFCNLIRDFDIDHYQVVYEARRDDALTSAFKLLVGKFISVQPEEIQLTYQSTQSFVGTYSKRFDPAELRKEMEMITELCPKITTLGENYELKIDLPCKYKGKKQVILRISPNGRSYLYDPETNLQQDVCLVTLPLGSSPGSAILYDDGSYQLSPGGSIALSVAYGALEKSASALEKIKKASSELFRN